MSCKLRPTQRRHENTWSAAGLPGADMMPCWWGRLRCAVTRQGAPIVALTGGVRGYTFAGLRSAQVVENPACFPHRATRRNPCLGGGVDYGCDLGVTNASLDGCLSADPASVAGALGAGGRDRGKRPLRNRCDMGGGVFVGRRHDRCPRH